MFFPFVWNRSSFGTDGINTEYSSRDFDEIHGKLKWGLILGVMTKPVLLDLNNISELIFLNI